MDPHPDDMDGDEEVAGEFVDVNDVAEVIDGDEDVGGDVDDGDIDDGEQVELDEEKRAHLEQQIRQVLDNDDSVQGFFEHKDSIYCLDISKSNTLVVSGGGDDVAYVWELSSGELKHKLSGHTDSVISVKFSADEQYVATASMDATVRVYKVSDGNLLHVLEGPSAEVEWMEWHPTGHVIVAGSADTTTWMWNAESGLCMRVFSGMTGVVTAGGFTTDGKSLITCSDEGSLMLFAPKTGDAVLHLKTLHEAPITSFAVHPTQKIAFTGAADGVAKIINLDNGKTLAEFKGHSDSVEGCRFAPTLKLAATGSVDGKLKVWDLQNGQCRVTCSHEDAITHLEWHPTEPYIFTSSMDKTIKMWDARSGSLEKTWHGHQEGVLTFALTSDGEKIVSGGDDQTLLVFNRK